MWAGIYGKYPDRTHLTTADKRQLWRHPFFSVTRANASKRLARYTHTRGSFERRRMASQTYWVERDTEGQPRYTFREQRVHGDRALAYGRGRGLWLDLGLAGGAERISSDAKRWSPLYTLTRTR